MGSEVALVVVFVGIFLGAEEEEMFRRKGRDDCMPRFGKRCSRGDKLAQDSFASIRKLI
jgi:hypothetical protein